MEQLFADVIKGGKGLVKNLNYAKSMSGIKYFKSAIDENRGYQETIRDIMKKENISKQKAEEEFERYVIGAVGVGVGITGLSSIVGGLGIGAIAQKRENSRLKMLLVNH